MVIPWIEICDKTIPVLALNLFMNALVCLNHRILRPILVFALLYLER